MQAKLPFKMNAVLEIPRKYLPQKPWKRYRRKSKTVAHDIQKFKIATIMITNFEQHLLIT